MLSLKNFLSKPDGSLNLSFWVIETQGSLSELEQNGCRIQRR